MPICSRLQVGYATEQENMAEVFKRARMTTPCLVVLEDLDAMIDDENRAFLLNELDGLIPTPVSWFWQPPITRRSSTRLFSTGPAGSIGSTISICRLRMNAEFIKKMERTTGGRTAHFATCYSNTRTRDRTLLVCVPEGAFCWVTCSVDGSSRR